MPARQYDTVNEPLTTTNNSIESEFDQFLTIIEHMFPIEFLITGELAQFETYAIPSISKLLHQTALYEKEGVKRLDDTRATMYEIFANPEGSVDRATMIEHLNWIHSHYQISNDDYLYTLLRMFFNPIESIEKWGWRKLKEEEIALMTKEMLRIGRAMNIHFESDDYQALHQWQENYRNNHQTYNRDNQAVAEGTIKAIQAHFPKWVRPIIPAFITTMLSDETLLKALGLAPPGFFQKSLVMTGVHGWRLLNHVYRPWRTKRFSQGWLANYYPSYPNNVLDLHTLGPKKLIQHRNKAGGCPFRK